MLIISQDGNVKQVGAAPANTTSIKSASALSELRYASPSALLATAHGVVEDVSSQSSVFDTEMEARIPRFHSSEIVTGHVLGRGGFCVCKEVEKVSARMKKGMSSREISDIDGEDGKKGFFLFRVMRRNKSKSALDSDSDSSLKSFSSTGGNQRDPRKLTRDYVIKRAAATRNGRKCGFVVKSVSSEVDKITYMKGNVDIALEAKYLSALNHRNIIELAAVSSSKPCTRGYFIVLERMEETLGAKLKHWMDRERMSVGLFGCFGGAKRIGQLYIERVEASCDIANALYYLHSKDIIYRDLKPDNIGFDRKGVLKLFDFGLAKELKEEDKEADGTYRNMTAMTGAIRYMAPEVGIGDSYNLAADVYSWSMLMWFILALEPPFGLYTDNMIMDRVWRRGHRPVIFKRWSDIIKGILKSSWEDNYSERPTFLDIVLALKEELQNCDNFNVRDSSVTTGVTDQD